MPPETEVISCPACKHLVRVPADWLGQTVQCPECQAKFTAPVRDGDRLTDPVLLSAPPAVNPPAARPRLDPFLLLPAWGLMLVGAAGAGVNGVKSWEYLTRPGAAERDIGGLTERARRGGYVRDGPEDPDERERFDAARAADYARAIRVLVPVFAAVSGVVFLGGLAMARRRGYRLAQLGCVLAAVNVANGCCVPGAVFGLWGLLMLMSEEGRAHFE
jgi:hypothetical protein